jgi:hypothetical protein
MSFRRFLPFFAVVVFAFTAPAQERTVLTRATSPITIDGSLTDPAWQSAAKYETWYETNPGDNIPAPFRSVGYVTYDDRFLYVGIEMDDPNPKQISGVYGDHDAISGQNDDFAGIIVDTRNDGRTALEFFVTSRNVQYDAVQDDGGSGEDSSPDFFWDSEVRIHERGWTVELRIPFSSLRYDNANPEQWGLILYRNMPRDRRFQMFTNKLPRDSSCFICHLGKVTGLTGLPTGNHIVLAPYATANRIEERDAKGILQTRPVGSDVGVDVKWSPTADTIIDATINPDFSQIESDVAVIMTNERFAINIAEKRPFFLEGVELFSTPIQAVYTRTITVPRWGARATGREGKYSYTVLAAQDEGGGSVLLPAAEGSNATDQDLSSLALIGRVRRDIGRNSFVSLLTTVREVEGDAHNRVFGPDFQWRIGDHHTITGQFLYASTQNPDIPLHEFFQGQKLAGHAAYAWYQYSTEKHDFYVNYSDYDEEFRADNGFVPQVGYRGSYVEGGRTWRPKGFFSRVRVYGFGEYQQKQDGELLYRLVSAVVGADGRKRSFWRLRLSHDTVRSRNEVFDRDRVFYTLQFSPNRKFTFVSLDGWIGDEVDFSQNRLGRGASIGLNGTLRPNEHLQINLTNSVRWLNVTNDRLFTAQVERIRAQYSFTSRMFVRAIVQNTRTNRDVPLFNHKGVQHQGGLATQLLFAYKLNWQTVFFVGAGDLQAVTPEEGDFLRDNRQVFAKISYAFQR